MEPHHDQHPFGQYVNDDPPTLPPDPDSGQSTITEDGLVAGGVLPDQALAPPGARLAHPDQASLERCFGFVDLCGFTRYTSEAGADAAVALLREFRDLIRTVAATRGVRIAKWLGDGCMVVGVAPGPVIATLAECLVRFPYPIRAGVSSGPTLLFEADDHVGPAVNMASRLCNLAGPDELLVGPEVVPFRPQWTRAVEVPAVELRGLGTVEGLCRIDVSPDVVDDMEDVGCPTRTPDPAAT